MTLVGDTRARFEPPAVEDEALQRRLAGSGWDRRFSPFGLHVGPNGEIGCWLPASPCARTLGVTSVVRPSDELALGARWADGRWTVDGRLPAGAVALEVETSEGFETRRNSPEMDWRVPLPEHHHAKHVVVRALAADGSELARGTLPLDETWRPPLRVRLRRLLASRGPTRYEPW